MTDTILQFIAAIYAVSVLIIISVLLYGIIRLLWKLIKSLNIKSNIEKKSN